MTLAPLCVCHFQSKGGSILTFPHVHIQDESSEEEEDDEDGDEPHAVPNTLH
jgi:hypothetical protein